MMIPQLNRITPVAPPQAYQTYSIVQPTDRTVVAACHEVGCAAWRQGWRTIVDEATALGREQAAYIRTKAGRAFREQRDGAGLTVFTFEAHQRCFAEHQTRPQFFGVRGGDWRGNPLGTARKHANAADWVEDFGENQQRLRDLQQRG